jgi:cytochrome c
MQVNPSSFFLVLAFCGLSASLPAWADDTAAAQALAQSSGCLSCHAKAEKIVGPAFVSIADKYRGDKDAVVSLAQSVQNGSRGKWGRVPMPAHPSLSQADLKTLAQWVLATKP